jgi:hypothetical protein
VYQEIQYSPAFALDRQGYAVNNTIFFLPIDDAALLGILNSPLMWWYSWRHLVHGKDDVLRPAAFKMSELPIPTIEDSARERIEREVTQILDLREAGAEAATELLDALALAWSEHSQPLVQGGRKGAAGLKTAFKKHVPQEEHPSKTQLRDLGFVADAFARKLSEISSRRHVVEARLSELVFDLYGLAKEEQALVWDTAPPRMPLASAEEASDEADDEEAAQESPRRIQ